MSYLSLQLRLKNTHRTDIFLSCISCRLIPYYFKNIFILFLRIQRDRRLRALYSYLKRWTEFSSQQKDRYQQAVSENSISPDWTWPLDEILCFPTVYRETGYLSQFTLMSDDVGNHRHCLLFLSYLSSEVKIPFCQSMESKLWARRLLILLF